MTAGSIEGDGAFIVGTNNLIVGSNNLSTLVTGIVDVCNCGALTKIGSGTLTLALDPTWSWLFSGSLVVNGGTVVVELRFKFGLSSRGQFWRYARRRLRHPSSDLHQQRRHARAWRRHDRQHCVFGGQRSSAICAGGTYAVDVVPAIPMVMSADFTSVVGPATLAGTLKATGKGGSGYTVGSIYPVLETFNGNTLNGTRFDNLFIAGSFGSTKPIITYGPLDDTVFLQLIQGEVSSQLIKGATQNQIALAAGLDNALKNGAISAPSRRSTISAGMLSSRRSISFPASPIPESCRRSISRSATSSARC